MVLEKKGSANAWLHEEGVAEVVRMWGMWFDDVEQEAATRRSMNEKRSIIIIILTETGSCSRVDIFCVETIKLDDNSGVEDQDNERKITSEMSTRDFDTDSFY